MSIRWGVFASLLGSLAAQTPAPKPPASQPKPAATKPATPAAKPAAAKPVPPKPTATKPPAAKVVPAKPAEPAVIVVGDQRITKPQFESLLAALPEALRARFANADGKKQLAEQLAELMCLAEEARAIKLDQEEKIRDQVKIQTDQILANALISRLAAAGGPIDEAELKAYFDEHVKEYQQITARHILIRFQGSRVPIRQGEKDLTEAEALAKTQDLAKRIAAGEDFAEVARKESDDTGSGAAGGALGSFGRGQMVKPFEDAVWELPVGKISEPVKTPFGWHLIQSQGTKNQTFEEARPMIEQRLKDARPKQMAEQIKKKYNLKVDASLLQ